MSYDPNQPQQPYGQAPFQQQPPPQYSPPPYGQPQYNIPPVPDYAAPQPPRKGPRRGLWIALAIIGGVIVLGCAACAIFGGSIIGLAFGLTAGPRNAVDDYYKAIEQQDYAKAYTYLDTSGVSIQGQQVTQPVYTQAAQAIDRVEGPVTNYTTTNTNVNNDTATVTVNVTRGTRATTQTLSLRKIGNDWKITGLANPGRSQ